MDYGSDVGTISLVVFREASGGGEPLALEEEAEDLAAVSPRPSRQSHGEPVCPEAPVAPGEREPGPDLQGQKIGAAIRRVEFRPDPTPVMSATITYYRP